MANLVTSYAVYDDAAGLGTLTTPSFVPGDGEVLVVKAVTADHSTIWSTDPTGGGWTYVRQVNDTTASHCVLTIWTADVAVGGTAMTVSLTPTGNNNPHSMVVERWELAQISATPAVVDVRGVGTPTATLTTSGDLSGVSWATGDWAAVDGAGRVYDATSAAPVEDGYRRVVGQYTAYYATQSAFTASSQTLGLTSPTGQTYTLVGIEIEDRGGVQLDPLTPSLIVRPPGRGSPVGTTTAWWPLQEGNYPPTPTQPTVDRSTVALVSDTVGTAGTLSTASFSVGAATGLIALVYYNTPVSTAVDHTVTGAGLTWTLAARKSRSTGSLGGAGTDGGVEIWWAYSSAGFSGQTVTTTYAAGTNAQTGLKVLLITGGQPEVVGAVVASSSSSGQPRVFATQTEPFSVVLSAFSDWSQKGAAVVSPDQAAFDPVDVVGKYTGWWQWRIAPDQVIAPHVLDELTNARQFNAAAVEIPGQVVVSGGTTMITITGAVNSSGTNQLQAAKTLVATSTPTASVVRSTSRTLVAITTSLGALTKALSRTLTAGITSAGTSTRQPRRTLTAGVTPTANVTRSDVKNLVGASTPTAALTRSLARSLVGTVTSSGALTATRLVIKSLAGVITSAGSLVRSTARALAGTTTSGGVTTRRTLKNPSGQINAAGTLALLKAVLRAFSGSTSPAGAIANRDVKTVTGAVTSGGATTRSIARGLVATITSSGALSTTRAILRTLTGTITSSATVTRRTTKVVVAQVTSSGQRTTLIARSLVGSLTSGGVVTRARTTFATLTGSITSSGSVRRATSRTLSATISATSTVRDGAIKLLSGVVNLAGDVHTITNPAHAATQLRIRVAGRIARTFGVGSRTTYDASGREGTTNVDGRESGD